VEIVWGEGAKATKAERPFEGLVAQMQRLYEETESELTRNRLRQYMSRRECSVCHGARLRPEILAVTIRGEAVAGWGGARGEGIEHPALVRADGGGRAGVRGETWC